MQQKLCTFEGCDSPSLAKGLCTKHYYDPIKTRRNWLRSKFGITPEQYEEQLIKQDGRCAICGRTDPGSRGRFVIDHDHTCCPGRKSCGKCVRGLLCNYCNPGIGNLNDDATLLVKAAQYIAGGGVWGPDKGS